MSDRQGSLRTYKTPLQPAPREWISQTEMVRRIEAVRSSPEPLTLPLGRLGEVAVRTTRRGS